MGSGNLFAISFPGRLGRNSFLVMKNKLPVPNAFLSWGLNEIPKECIIEYMKMKNDNSKRYLIAFQLWLGLGSKNKGGPKWA